MQFRLRNFVGSEIWSRACVFRTALLLPSTATHAGWNSKCCCHQHKNKTPACIREIQVYKLWTKVYSQKGLTLEGSPCVIVTWLPPSPTVLDWLTPCTPERCWVVHDSGSPWSWSVSRCHWPPGKEPPPPPACTGSHRGSTHLEQIGNMVPALCSMYRITSLISDALMYYIYIIYHYQWLSYSFQTGVAS